MHETDTLEKVNSASGRFTRDSTFEQFLFCTGLSDVVLVGEQFREPAEKSPPLWGSKFLGGKASDWSRIQNPAF